MSHLIGYCTNVHSGNSLEQVKSNLLKHAVEVRRLLVDHDESSRKADRLSGEFLLPVGLWLSNAVAEEIESNNQVSEFRQWLSDHHLLPYTLNGFPFSDFHQPVVKHEVYLPTWAETSRLQYTLRLARLLDQLLPEGERGTISTLPIGWPRGPKDRSGNTIEARFSSADQATIHRSAEQIKTLAEELSRLESRSGRLIQICFEPEPGCLLDCADDVVLFFNQCLFDGDDSTNAPVRRHITVCHDVCHSAVMFESQEHAIRSYGSAGISIGKIQVSSAVEANFGLGHDADVWKELAQFAEPKYLHQTTVANPDGSSESLGGEKDLGLGFDTFFEDLSLAIGQRNDLGGGFKDWTNRETWRVHFHVPIFLSKLGHLHTTQHEIETCFRAIDFAATDAPHLEVETYAWNVLPDSQREQTLASGIAQEIMWLGRR